MHVYLEITNCCNRQCSFCPGTGRKKLFADPGLLRSRMEKIRSRAEILYLHVLGEPLLHPQFEEILRHCEEIKIPVNLTTNGTLLTEEKQTLLLRCKTLRQINFSLQALEETELPLLDRILQFSLKALEQREDLYLNLRMWNIAEKDFSLPAKDLLFLQKIFHTLELPFENGSPGPLFRKHHRSLNLKGRLYLHCNDLFEWPVQVKDSCREQPGKVFCHGLNKQIAILADGSVVPCCLDSEGIMVLGNLDEHASLEEILSAKRAQRIKEGFRNGAAAEMLCRKCTYRTTHVTAIRRGTSHPEA